jgi:hypothetical protein
VTDGMALEGDLLVRYGGQVVAVATEHQSDGRGGRTTRRMGIRTDGLKLRGTPP